MNVIDLFAGCGGLALGFKRAGFHSIGYVEWDRACVETLRANFQDQRIEPLIIHEDIRATEKYLTNDTASLVSKVAEHRGIDGIIGGPPCQAYSMAGRVRDPNGMRNDYRNYLFEAYCDVLKELRPNFFVFENVVGMLSARPNGVPVSEEISEAFSKLGYRTGKIDNSIVYNLSDYGGPQNRKRVIIFGVKSSVEDVDHRVAEFHRLMRTAKKRPGNVWQAIGDLPKLVPLPPNQRSRKASHQLASTDHLHVCRFHNDRDIEIFRLLANDAKSTSPKYTSVESIKELYKERVGRSANVHKYYVLKEDEPSNLIPAHLHKDGLRHIHPDPEQARSITAREAARLQTFPDDFKFVGSRSDVFKMIGNAVPPMLAEVIAKNVRSVM